MRLELAALGIWPLTTCRCRDRCRPPAATLVTDHQESPASLLSYVEGLPARPLRPDPGVRAPVGVLLARVDHALGLLPGGRGALAHDITDLAAARDRLASCRKLNGFPWQRVATRNRGRRPRGRDLARLPRQVIHGDVSRGNIIFDDRRFALIDFGDAGAGPRIADSGHRAGAARDQGGGRAGDLGPGCGPATPPSPTRSDAERAALLRWSKLRYAQLIVDHVWRELSAPHHPGHLALVALGIEGLHALASAPAGDAVARRPDAGGGVSARRAACERLRRLVVHPGARRDVRRQGSCSPW